MLDDTARSPRDSADALAERIIAAEKKGRRFIAKFGIDPTGAEVHLGHTVPMLILSRFRRMGHHAVSIVDDMTVKIGARAAAATASTTASR